MELQVNAELLFNLPLGDKVNTLVEELRWKSTERMKKNFFYGYR